MNGPDEYPGAKILEKRNGENISLRYVDRESLRLEIGDTVHRHMMDGDGILFNRQPTLHRMSMMLMQYSGFDSMFGYLGNVWVFMVCLGVDALFRCLYFA